MYENISFKKQNMVVIEDDFYMFDNDLNDLVRKMSGGSVSFTYPLSTSLSSEVKSLEYDGINFWILQSLVDGISISRWKVNNYICNLKQQFNYADNGFHTYRSSAFTVEHYHTYVSSTISGGAQIIYVDDYYDTVISGGITLTIGPNSNNNYEDVVISSVSGTNITLISGTVYGYDVGDEVNFYNHLWVFNNYNGLSETGALYKFDAHSGDYIEKFSDSEYKDVTACTFTRVNGVFDPDIYYGTFTNADTLLYVKSTNIKYINVNNLSNYDVMTIDNLESNGSTVITVYDLAVVDKTIYRLQNEANYYGSDVSWGGLYNYQVSTVRRFLDSISVSAYPAVVPANGYSIIEVAAVVLDQYGEGVVHKPVFFTDTDGIGFITTNPAFTDITFGTGRAVTYYKSGTSPDTITIEGTATQYD